MYDGKLHLHAVTCYDDEFFIDRLSLIFIHLVRLFIILTFYPLLCVTLVILVSLELALILFETAVTFIYMNMMKDFFLDSFPFLFYLFHPLDTSTFCCLFVISFHLLFIVFVSLWIIFPISSIVHCALSETDKILSVGEEVILGFFTPWKP